MNTVTVTSMHEVAEANTDGVTDDPKSAMAETITLKHGEQAASSGLVTRATSPRGLIIILITATAKMVDDML